MPWWDLFQDPQLKALITIAVQENRDLKIAVERIEEMRANLGIAKADLYPKLDANITGGGINPSDGSLMHLPDGQQTAAIYRATLDLSWEIDFFGRVRRASEAQKALLLASDEARRAVAIALVSDVAMTYLDLRGLDQRLALSDCALGEPCHGHCIRKQHTERNGCPDVVEVSSVRTPGQPHGDQRGKKDQPVLTAGLEAVSTRVHRGAPRCADQPAMRRAVGS